LLDSWAMHRHGTNKTLTIRKFFNMKLTPR